LWPVHILQQRWAPPHCATGAASPHAPPLPPSPLCVQNTQNTVVFSAKSASQMLQNCLVRGNFVLSPGHAAPAAQSSTLLLRGAAVPKLVGTTVEFQAVEASQFAKPTAFSMLRNVVAGGQVANAVVFRVAAWGGGIDAGGKIVTGKFR
jgi:hypothetical protein